MPTRTSGSHHTVAVNSPRLQAGSAGTLVSYLPCMTSQRNGVEAPYSALVRCGHLRMCIRTSPVRLGPQLATAPRHLLFRCAAVWQELKLDTQLDAGLTSSMRCAHLTGKTLRCLPFRTANAAPGSKPSSGAVWGYAAGMPQWQQKHTALHQKLDNSCPCLQDVAWYIATSSWALVSTLAGPITYNTQAHA
ncbi:hypothetical protein HaLaN_19261 [Haematococcus lacustris]|uniref:Uncharacterized protein n=1 Tax=Haematococcus lacustris TaxID=44745 RepID=A0A699ZI09_HAELA|nr:hypothetical protein HaLaN_19261 [Haematococcus lacustris]